MKKKFSSEPMIRGGKNATILNSPLSPQGKLARQMLAKGSAEAPLFTKGEGRRCYEINHADSSIKKNQNILCCFSSVGKKLDRESQVCTRVL